MKSGDFRSAAGSFWMWILLTVTATCLLPGVNALECFPDNDGPCFCGTAISVDCTGFSDTPLTQAHINDFFSKLRLHNRLATNDTLKLSSFNLEHSNLTTFDLTPLFRAKMTYFDISYNSQLTRLSGTETDTGTGLIEAYLVRFQFNALTTEGLGETFKLFNGLRLHKIELDYNRLRGVPDLSTLKNLQYLNLYRNDISELKAGSFRSLTDLREVKLTNNPVDYVRESAFLIDPPPTNDSSPYSFLHIDLDGTNLRSGGFSAKSGIDKIKREVFLSLSSHFDSLPQDIFQPFFEANPSNVVSLQFNKELQCDSRVKWLQERKDEFKNRVGGEAECSNDPGRTIWDSKKVQGDSNNSGWSVGPPGPGILISLGLVLFYIMYFSEYY